MGRNAFLALVFLISISVATDLRVHAAVEGDKVKSHGEQISPSPSPLPSMKPDSLSDNSGKNPSKPGSIPKNASSHPPVPPVPSNSTNSTTNSTTQGSNVDPHDMDNHTKESKTPDISSKQKDKGQKDGECKSSSARCPKGKLVACLQYRASGSHELFLLVKNEGVDTLTVNIKAPASKINNERLDLAEHQQKNISVPVNARDNLKIVFDAGNGECVLQFGKPVSWIDIFHQLPSYATRMTPIYGAYLLFLALLIVGGTWACCKFSKRGRRVDGGVPYQELEMGLPQSTSAAVVDTGDGWDEGWDDDWEEKATARAPEIRHVGNVSANGLTSRAPNREGWEDDWDD
ncbi:dentin sialophosphoprotein-like protein [Cinnamomum micranthum f. kanehirae]|uniref:Dentin sialophosphoprotein-like protein n=1 Tax=Cinnamomum micranthum f. kanehirae TaxID=337451 RepID=A0A443NKK1_9MAGN|nr:dentin sialophosphoprotein-like protein [Cinnamomum micranthum f. kanehirae]